MQYTCNMQYVLRAYLLTDQLRGHNASAHHMYILISCVVTMQVHITYTYWSVAWSQCKCTPVALSPYAVAWAALLLLSTTSWLILLSSDSALLLQLESLDQPMEHRTHSTFLSSASARASPCLSFLFWFLKWFMALRRSTLPQNQTRTTY